MEPTMEQQYLDKAAEHPTLGPHYFAARDAAEKFMADFEAENFSPLLKKAAETFMETMQESLENWLLSNVESNLQGTIWRQIDESVKALLSGERWALERYALGERYDCEKIRVAVAKHIPSELQDKRIADLEAENKRLREDLAWHRRESVFRMASE
jgi:hypothetical protein